jgi:exodeoxyribonuclease VII small subunit
VASKPSEQPEKYEDVVRRLDEVVRQLESGNLSLEDSLKAFEEGIGLVRKGESRLAEAEQRIEVLLSDQGDKRVPLDAAPKATGPISSPSPAPAVRAPPRGKPAPDDDVPF